MTRAPVPGREREEAQTLVLLAVLLLVLVGFLGLTLDGGNAYVQRRATQNAADAAVLAGVWELDRGSSPETILARISEYAIQRNGASDFVATYTPGGQPVVASQGTPPAGASGICVVAGKNFSPFFMKAFGFHTMRVQARACAEQVQCMGGVAIWADDRAGTGLTISGSDSTINGLVHTNSRATLSGSYRIFNGLCQWVTGWTQSGQHYTYNPSTGNPRQVAAATMPVSYDISAYRPGGAAAMAASAAGKYHYIIGNLVGSGSGQRLDGLYYVTGNVTFSGANLSGTATIVAEGSINMSGAGRDLAPYADGLLLFSNNAGLTMSGANNTWRGVYYAPRGPIVMSGANNTTTHGSLFGRTVTLSGAYLTINYDRRYCPSTANRIRLSQ